ncbi:SAM domain-containing protein [Natrialbaceae archaeon A-gly3]
MRRSLVVALALLAVALVFVGGPSLLTTPSTSDVAPTEEPTPEIVTLEDSDSGFWPYLNAREVHEKRSPLNVIVRGDTRTIVAALEAADETGWEETDHDHFDADELLEPATPGNESEDNASNVLSPTNIPWSQADGATRYAYLDPEPDEEGYWTTETLQLEDGEYYGYRYHIRLYESPNPDDEWAVMQTHSEHFDWLTLRHRVDGVEAAQSRVEADLMDVPGVDVQEDVRRVYLDNDGPSDADGWATKVDLTALAALSIALGLTTRREGVIDRASEEVDDHLTDVDRARLEAAYARIEARHLMMVGTIIAVILGVRILGIALDRTADVLTVHMIAALLYPVIAIGLPVATYGIASGLERRLDAAVSASSSLAVAIWLDYALLGVDVLPIDVVVQRMLVVVALGLIAGGATRRATRESRITDMLLVGTTMWVLVLAGTLLGYL